MATPAMQLQSVPLNINGAAPGSVFIPTRTPAGVTIDVSSGYTLGKAQAMPNGSSPVYSSPIDIHTMLSVAFSTTGVTVSWTKAQAAAILSAVLGYASAFGLSVSNDAGTTETEVEQGQLSNINPSGLTF